MWKELTAEDLRAKARPDAIVILPGGLDGAARAASAGRRRHHPVRGRVPGAPPKRIAAKTAGGGRADAVVRHGRASHGVRRHLHVRHPDLSGGAALLPEEHRAARLQARVHRQRPRRQHRGASTPSCRISRARPASTLRATTYFELAKAAMARVPRGPESVHHACEVETSMMMVVAPETVKHERLPRRFGPRILDAAARPIGARYHSFKESRRAA